MSETQQQLSQLQREKVGINTRMKTLQDRVKNDIHEKSVLTNRVSELSSKLKIAEAKILTTKECSDNGVLNKLYKEVCSSSEQKAQDLEEKVIALSKQLRKLESQRDTFDEVRASSNVSVTQLHKKLMYQRQLNGDLNGKLIVMAQVHEAMEQKILQYDEDLAKLSEEAKQQILHQQNVRVK